MTIMKNAKLFLAALMVTAFSFAAQAQSDQRTNVGQLSSGLINVNVGAVAVNIGDITLEDLVDVDDVANRGVVVGVRGVAGVVAGVRGVAGDRVIRDDGLSQRLDVRYGH